MHHNYLEIFLFLALVVAIAKLAGWLSSKAGQPAVFGEILAGLLLGPTLIGIAALPLFPESRSEILRYARQKAAVEETETTCRSQGNDATGREIVESLTSRAREVVLSAPETEMASQDNRETISQLVAPDASKVLNEPKSYLEEVMKVLAEIGVVFLMFIAGLETDMAMMRRVGRVAFWAAIGGVIGPFVLGMLATMFLLPSHDLYTAIYAGTVLCATSVSISAQTLRELNALTSKEGTTILGAAVIDDVIGIIVLSLVIAFHQGSGGEGFPKLYELVASRVVSDASPETSCLVGVAFLIAFMTAFFVVFYFLGSLFFEKLLSWAERMPVSEPKLAIAISLGLFFAWGAEYLGAIAAITGSYFAGVLIAQTSHREEIIDRLSVVTYSFLVPIFFINIGLEADAKSLAGHMAWFALWIVLVAIAGKVAGCLLGARLSGFSTLESLRVGVGMVSRGEVGLIVASVGLSSGIIQKDVFSTMVVMVLATTLATPIMLRWVFPRNHCEKEAD